MVLPDCMANDEMDGYGTKLFFCHKASPALGTIGRIQMTLRSILRALFTKLTHNAEIVPVSLPHCLSTRCLISHDVLSWLKVGLLSPYESSASSNAVEHT